MIFHIWRVRDGRLVRLTTHLTKEEALAAAGQNQARKAFILLASLSGAQRLRRRGGVPN
jgi:hypothetical protein